MNDLIHEIFKFHGTVFLTPILSQDLKIKLEENFKKYENVDINELDPNHSWMLIQSRSYLVTSHIYLDKNFKKYLTGAIYICVLTGDLGYTFSDGSRVIKPFVVVKHKWRRILADEFDPKQHRNYRHICDNCKALGYRVGEGKNSFLPADEMLLLSCEERIVAEIV